MTMREQLLQAPIVGFDVFDTLMTRAVGHPTDVFWYVGGSLRAQSMIAVSPAAYCRVRIWSERLGRRTVEGREVRMDEIMPLVCRALGLPVEQAGRLREVELAEEKRWIRPVSEMAEILAERRRRGLKSVLVSDTYLSRDDVHELLGVCGLEVDPRDIFVSSEHRCNKASQKLFEKVLQHVCVPATGFVFVGDNLESDVRAPGRMNITAIHFRRSNPTRYESALGGFRESTRGLSCLMAGASRRARLVQGNADAHREALARVAAGVIGPATVAYVTWVLRDASQRKLKRLYFLAREGQLLIGVARRLVAKLGIDIECRYLYASRQAWRLPAISTIGDFECNWMLAANGRLSLKGIAARIDIDPEVIARCARRAGVDAHDLGRDLSRDEVERMRGMFDGPEVATILERAAARRQETLAYLEQEGLFDGTRWAMVDVGWEASLQRCLDSLVWFRGQRVEMGYYIGLRSFPPYRSTDHRHLAYLFDDRIGSGVCLRPFQVVPLIETFLRADHGMTLRYERQGDHMAPVLREDKTQMVIDWGVRDIHATVLAFVDALLDALVDPSTFNPSKRTIAALLKLFWEKPVADEVKAWGSYPFGADQTGVHWERLASPVEPQMWIDALLGRHLPQQHPDQWMLGSAAISPPVSALLTRTLFGMASGSRKLNHLVHALRRRSRRRRRTVLAGL